MATAGPEAFATVGFAACFVVTCFACFVPDFCCAGFCCAGFCCGVEEPLEATSAGACAWVEGAAAAGFLALWQARLAIKVAATGAERMIAKYGWEENLILCETCRYPQESATARPWLLFMRCYYRKNRWVNATEDTPGSLP